MNISLYVALIHNNNQARNIYLQPQIDNLIKYFDSHVRDSSIEISFQPELAPHSLIMAFMRDCLFMRLGHNWRKYRQIKPRFFLIEAVVFCKYIFLKYFIQSKDTKRTWGKHSFVEMALTDKHIRSWTRFLESGSDFMIVLEDDVVFKGDSLSRLNSLLNTKVEKYKNKPCYVDLAGGMELQVLMIDSLEDYRDTDYRYYKKPVTNTTCAYLISRELAIIFYKTLINKPWLRFIAIDWLLNALFILNEDQMSGGIFMHSDPTIFKHGSITGEYTSWH
jgi:hypothetical protein